MYIHACRAAMHVGIYIYNKYACKALSLSLYIDMHVRLYIHIYIYCITLIKSRGPVFLLCYFQTRLVIETRCLIQGMRIINPRL